MTLRNHQSENPHSPGVFPASGFGGHSDRVWLSHAHFWFNSENKKIKNEQICSTNPIRMQIVAVHYTHTHILASELPGQWLIKRRNLPRSTFLFKQLSSLLANLSAWLFMLLSACMSAQPGYLFENLSLQLHTCQCACWVLLYAAQLSIRQNAPMNKDCLAPDDCD